VRFATRGTWNGENKTSHAPAFDCYGGLSSIEVFPDCYERFAQSGRVHAEPLEARWITRAKAAVLECVEVARTRVTAGVAGPLCPWSDRHRVGDAPSAPKIAQRLAHSQPATTP